MHTKHIQQDSHRQDPARKQGLRLPLRIRQKPAHLCRRPNSCRCTTAVTSEQCTAIIRQCNLNSYRQSYRQKNRLKGAATQPQPRQEKLDLCRRPNSCRCTTAVTSEQRTAIARQCTIKKLLSTRLSTKEIGWRCRHPAEQNSGKKNPQRSIPNRKQVVPSRKPAGAGNPAHAQIARRCAIHNESCGFPASLQHKKGLGARLAATKKSPCRATRPYDEIHKIHQKSHVPAELPLPWEPNYATRVAKTTEP